MRNKFRQDPRLDTNLKKMKGNIIKKEIHKITEVKTTMKIFLCGEKFPENIYSYITGRSQQPSLNQITINYKENNTQQKTVEVKNYKHPNENLDWDYYYFREGELEENRLHEILSVIKSNYIYRKEENNVLIFVSQIDDSDEINHFIENICQNYFSYSGYYLRYVEVIFMNYNKKGYFDLYIINDYIMNDDDDDDDEVEYEKVGECDEEKILKVLFEKCSYLNQLGDCVVFPFNEFSLKREHEDNTNNIYGNTLNVLVIGNSGSGKSTLINKILRKKKAKIGMGADVTKRIAFYFKDRIALFDTPGITLKEDESTYIDLIKKNIEDKHNLNNQIHAIFYTINAQCMRPSYELIINILKSFPKIKLYILLTKTGINQRGREKYLDRFKWELEETTEKLGIVNQDLMDRVFLLELKSKENGLKELLERVHKDFEEYNIDINQIIQELETAGLMIKEIPLKLGYVDVENRSKQDLIDKIPMKEACKKEKEFFSKHPIYGKMPPGHFGTDVLIQKLTKIYFRVIHEYLPKSIKKINDNIKESEEELRRLGRPMPVDDAGKMSLFWSMLNEYCKMFKNVLRGKFDSKRHKFLKDEGGYKIKGLYKKLLDEFTGDYKATAEYKDSDIDMALTIHGGNSIPGFPSVDAFVYLLQPQLDKLSDPIYECFEKVFEYLDHLSSLILEYCFTRFPQAVVQIGDLVNQILNKEKEKTKHILDCIVDQEINYLFTNDYEYMEKYTTFIPREQEQTKPGQAQKPIDVKAAFIKEIRNRIEAYFKLIVRNLRDSVPKTIGNHLVRSIESTMQIELYNMLYSTGDIVSSLDEPESIMIKRKELTQRIKVMKNFQKFIKKMFKKLSKGS